MTQLELQAHGVAFFYRGGQPHAKPPTPEALAALRDAIAWRVPLLREQYARGCASPQPLDAGPRARHGQCAVCGEPLAPHRGGDCMLCIKAWRDVLREHGFLQAPAPPVATP